MEVPFYWLPARKTPNRADLPGSPHARAKGCAWSRSRCACNCTALASPAFPNRCGHFHTQKRQHTVWERKLPNCDPTGLRDQTAAAEARRASTLSHAVMDSHSLAHKRTLQPLKPIHRPRQSALTHQRPRGPEAAKHKHGAHGAEVGLPSRAPSLLCPAPSGVGKGLACVVLMTRP